jgi:Spy/CpxP family protein refolding chaperone
MQIRRDLVILTALFALLSYTSPALADDRCEGKDCDMNEHMGMMRHGGMDGERPGAMARMTVDQMKQRLGLSDDQASKLKDLRRSYLKETMTQTTKVRIAELELDDLLDEKKLDAGKIEKKVREMEALRGDLMVSRVRFLLKAADFLTPEQFQSFRAMTTRGMGAAGKGMGAPRMGMPPHEGSGMGQGAMPNMPPHQ